MKRPVIHITDHAVLRYIERVMGIDVDDVRRQIARKVDVGADHPTANAVLSNGFRYILKEGALVTVRPVDGSFNRRKAPQRLPDHD